MWRDVRVLRWLFQLAVLGVVIAVLAWLYSNYRTNVERTNIPTDFSFLDRPSNFEIPGNAMSSTAPVRNAFVQGFLNTMRVAVAGLVLATVLGTLIGIGRLSHNAVLSTLCRVYVEIVRNIPLLVILLFANLGLVLQVLPRIENVWQPLGISVLSNRGIAIPWFEGSGWGLVALVVVGAVAALDRQLAAQGVRPHGHTGAISAVVGGRRVDRARRRVAGVRVRRHVAGSHGSSDRRGHPTRPVVLRTARRVGRLHGQPHR